jgi:hypothetical protein
VHERFIEPHIAALGHQKLAVTAVELLAQGRQTLPQALPALGLAAVGPEQGDELGARGADCRRAIQRAGLARARGARASAAPALTR